jgi:hypothetical protein
MAPSLSQPKLSKKLVVSWPDPGDYSPFPKKQQLFSKKLPSFAWPTIGPSFSILP